MMGAGACGWAVTQRHKVDADRKKGLQVDSADACDGR